MKNELPKTGDQSSKDMLYTVTQKRSITRNKFNDGFDKPKPQIICCSNNEAQAIGILQKVQPFSIELASKNGYNLKHQFLTGEYQVPIMDELTTMHVRFIAEFKEHGKHFHDDTATRDIFDITLKRDGREFKFTFGQSVNSTEKQEILTPYNVFSALTWYDPGDFENFCDDMGYDPDSKTAEKIYKAVCDEYKNLQTLFSSKEMERLSEIAR